MAQAIRDGLRLEAITDRIGEVELHPRLTTGRSGSTGLLPPCHLPESCRLLEFRGAGIERELTGGPIERVDRLVSEQLTADRRQAGPRRHVLERDVARRQPPIAVPPEHGASDASAEI